MSFFLLGHISGFLFYFLFLNPNILFDTISCTQFTNHHSVYVCVCFFFWIKKYMLLLFEKETPHTNIAPNIVLMTFIDQLRKITYITVWVDTQLCHGWRHNSGIPLRSLHNARDRWKLLKCVGQRVSTDPIMVF